MELFDILLGNERFCTQKKDVRKQGKINQGKKCQGTPNILKEYKNKWLFPYHNNNTTQNNLIGIIPIIIPQSIYILDIKFKYRSNDYCELDQLIVSKTIVTGQ